MQSIADLRPLQERGIDSPNVANATNTSIDIPSREEIQKPASYSVITTQILLYLGANSANAVSQVSWKRDIEFTIQVRQLALFAPELLSSCLSSVFSRLCPLCNSLRSAVVKASLLAIQDLFFSLKVCICSSIHIRMNAFRAVTSA